MDILEIIIRGPHDSGKTTVASLLRDALKELGFREVQLQDTPPLPPDKKDSFSIRLGRTLRRPVRIRVELKE